MNANIWWIIAFFSSIVNHFRRCGSVYETHTAKGATHRHNSRVDRQREALTRVRDTEHSNGVPFMSTMASSALWELNKHKTLTICGWTNKTFNWHKLCGTYSSSFYAATLTVRPVLVSSNLFEIHLGRAHVESSFLEIHTYSINIPRKTSRNQTKWNENFVKVNHTLDMCECCSNFIKHTSS